MISRTVPSVDRRVKQVWNVWRVKTIQARLKDATGRIHLQLALASVDSLIGLSETVRTVHSSRTLGSVRPNKRGTRTREAREISRPRLHGMWASQRTHGVRARFWYESGNDRFRVLPPQIRPHACRRDTARGREDSYDFPSRRCTLPARFPYLQALRSASSPTTNLKRLVFSTSSHF